MLDRATPGLTAYNVPRAIRIRGPLDATALRAAIDDVIVRHEVLRTTYASEGGHGVQVVQPHRPLVLPCIDVSALEHVSAQTAAADRSFGNIARDSVLLGGWLDQFSAEAGGTLFKVLAGRGEAAGSHPWLPNWVKTLALPWSLGNTLHLWPIVPRHPTNH